MGRPREPMPPHRGNADSGRQADRQVLVAAHVEVLAVAQVDGQELERFQLREQDSEHDLRLDPGQVRADAVMVAVAEGQMEVRMSGHVEAIGVREMRRVRGWPRPARAGRAVRGEWTHRRTPCPPWPRGLETGDGLSKRQALLHGVRYQGGLRAKPRKLFRVLELCLRLQRGAACGAGIGPGNGGARKGREGAEGVDVDYALFAWSGSVGSSPGFVWGCSGVSGSLLLSRESRVRVPDGSPAFSRRST